MHLYTFIIYIPDTGTASALYEFLLSFVISTI